MASYERPELIWVNLSYMSTTENYAQEFIFFEFYFQLNFHILFRKVSYSLLSCSYFFQAGEFSSSILDFIILFSSSLYLASSLNEARYGRL